MNRIVYVVAFVRNEGRILFIKDEKGQYRLPRTELHDLEEPLKALNRIFAEQLQGKIGEVQLFDLAAYDDRVSRAQDLAAIYLVACNGLSGSPEKYVWKKLPEIHHLQLDDATKQIINSSSRLGLEIAERPMGQESDVKKSTVIEKQKIIIYCDGGSRGNPGPSAAGFVVRDSSERVIIRDGRYLGITTNNQAEYQAVLLGLARAYQLGSSVVEIRMDSMLVVNQMNGRYQIKNRELWPIYAKIKKLIEQFDRVTFVHVRREFNQEADSIVNRVLDERHIHNNML